MIRKRKIEPSPIRPAQSTAVKNKMARPTIIFATLLAIIALIISVITGYLQFGIATVGCLRLPVASTTFAAAYTYTLPGENLYGPSPFNRYFCTEQQAIAAGFRHSVLTAAGLQQQQQTEQQLRSQMVFSPSKIDFTAYSPNYVPTRFQKSGLRIGRVGSNEAEVFQDLTSGKLGMAEFRQADLSSVGLSYWPCTLNTCDVIGEDAGGRTIYKYYYKNTATIVWGVKLSKSYFQIEAGARADMTDQEATAMLSSLQPVN